MPDYNSASDEQTAAITTLTEEMVQSVVDDIVVPNDSNKIESVSTAPTTSDKNKIVTKQLAEVGDAKDDKIVDEDDVIIIENDGDKEIETHAADERKKSPENDEIQFIGEYGNYSKSKRRVYMTIRNESIAAMRLTIRRSINSQFYYQMLVKEVMKKYDNKATILRDTQFDIFTRVFEDIYRVELLYKENFQKRLLCQRKPFELFTRPKSLIALMNIIEEARQMAIKTENPTLKNYLLYFNQRKKVNRNKPSTSNGSNRHSPYSTKQQFTLEELVFQLSQPTRYVNLNYSDESSD